MNGKSLVYMCTTIFVVAVYIHCFWMMFPCTQSGFLRARPSIINLCRNAMYDLRAELIVSPHVNRRAGLSVTSMRGTPIAG